jgi:dolichol-phosphate mannosyltransferase
MPDDRISRPTDIAVLPSRRGVPTDPRVVVVVPTYNERENLPRVVSRLMSLDTPGLHVLVVDDSSPDGTGEVADALADRFPGRLHVLHRAGKGGLGLAYVAGMTRALALGADVVIQMDADLSHPVDVVPRMLRTVVDGADVAVGSRYTTGGSTSATWPWHRRLLSRSANIYIDTVLGLQVRDATSGFKAWTAESLHGIDLTAVRSAGYAFQIEMAHSARRLGLAVAEVPIHFDDRTAGVSKMTLRVQLEALVLPWRLRRRGCRA